MHAARRSQSSARSEGGTRSATRRGGCKREAQQRARAEKDRTRTSAQTWGDGRGCVIDRSLGAVASDPEGLRAQGDQHSWITKRSCNVEEDGAATMQEGLQPSSTVVSSTRRNSDLHALRLAWICFPSLQCIVACLLLSLRSGVLRAQCYQPGVSLGAVVAHSVSCLCFCPASRADTEVAFLLWPLLRDSRQ